MNVSVTTSVNAAARRAMDGVASGTGHDRSDAHSEPARSANFRAGGIGWGA